MKNSHLLNSICAFLIGACILSNFAGCSQDESKESTEKAKPMDGKTLVEEKCNMCHFSDRIYKEKRSRQEWISLVQAMRSKNPGWISSEEGDVITLYLTKNLSND